MYGNGQALIDRFGKTEIVRLSQIEDRETEVINENKVTIALSDASALIDSYLRGRYIVPVKTPPQDLIRAVCIIARFDMAKSARSDPTDQMVKDYDAVLKWLLDVQKGVARLDIPLIGNVENSGARFEDREAIFTPQNLRGS